MCILPSAKLREDILQTENIEGIQSGVFYRPVGLNEFGNVIVVDDDGEECLAHPSSVFFV